MAEPTQPTGTTADTGAGSEAISATELALLVMVLIWAVNFSVIKVGLAEIPPLAFNALRFPFAALAVYLLLRRRGPVPLPRAEDVPRIIGLGLLGNVAYQFFFIFGMDNTRAGNASVLLASTPILTAILSVALRHERSEARLWTGAAATVLGMAVVVMGGSPEVATGSETVAGDLLMVGASMIWATYTVGGREVVGRYGSIAVTAWTLWVGTLGLVLAGLPSLAALEWTAVSAAAWASVVYAGVLGIGMAYVLWYHGVRNIGSTRTATFANLVPVVALAVAWAWLNEVPTAWQLVGAGVIIGGVTLARRRKKG